MGKPKGQEEVESVLRRHCRRWGTGSREKEPGPEWEPEVALEEMPEKMPGAVPELM